MYKVILLFLISFSVHAQQEVDPRLSEYVSSFESTFNTIVTIDVIITYLPPNNSGRCRRSFSDFDKVLISREYYENNKDNYYSMEYLVFHELGHCIFNLVHDTRLFVYKSRNVPFSIMHPAIIGGLWFYKPLRMHYIHQMRTAIEEVTDENSKKYNNNRY